jgi:hypothetical protein
VALLLHAEFPSETVSSLTFILNGAVVVDVGRRRPGCFCVFGEFIGVVDTFGIIEIVYYSAVRREKNAKEFEMIGIMIGMKMLQVKLVKCIVIMDMHHQV